MQRLFVEEIGPSLSENRRWEITPATVGSICPEIRPQDKSPAGTRVPNLA